MSIYVGLLASMRIYTLALFPVASFPSSCDKKLGEEPGNEASSQAVPSANVLQILAVETQVFVCRITIVRKQGASSISHGLAQHQRH